MTRRLSQLDNLLSKIPVPLSGEWWVKNQLNQAQRSRAEKNEPEVVRAACETIGPVLDRWEFDFCDSERKYVQCLFDYLCEETENCEIKTAPTDRDKLPDILIDDVLALELRCSLSRMEKDRLIKIVTAYSREWVTWIVLLEISDSQAVALEKQLAEKGLDRTVIFSFS